MDKCNIHVVVSYRRQCRCCDGEKPSCDEADVSHLYINVNVMRKECVEMSKLKKVEKRKCKFDRREKDHKPHGHNKASSSNKACQPRAATQSSALRVSM
jgi:hypothetical protein